MDLKELARMFLRETDLGEGDCVGDVSLKVLVHGFGVVGVEMGDLVWMGGVESSLELVEWLRGEREMADMIEFECVLGVVTMRVTVRGNGNGRCGVDVELWDAELEELWGGGMEKGVQLADEVEYFAGLASSWGK